MAWDHADALKLNDASMWLTACKVQLERYLEGRQLSASTQSSAEYMRNQLEHWTSMRWHFAERNFGGDVWDERPPPEPSGRVNEDRGGSRQETQSYLRGSAKM